MTSSFSHPLGIRLTNSNSSTAAHRHEDAQIHLHRSQLRPLLLRTQRIYESKLLPPKANAEISLLTTLHQELEHHYLIIKRNNLRLQAAMQQMQATFPQDHQVNDARVQALHKNSIHVVRYTMRDASNAMEIMQIGMHTRGNAVKRVVARLVGRLSGQGPAWSRSG